MIEIESVGIDTGYGDTKGAFINSAGVALALGFPSLVQRQMKFQTSKQDDKALLWQVKADKNWFSVGRDVDRDSSIRVFAEDYFRTPEYKALTKAMLSTICAQQDASVIKTLTLGLPVGQYKDPENRKYLIDCYKGSVETFRGTQPNKMEIQNVIVVPQPAGAFERLLVETPEALESAESTIIDVGNGTTDCIIINKDVLSVKESRFFQKGMHWAKMKMVGEMSEQGYPTITVSDLDRYFYRQPVIVGRTALTDLIVKPFLEFALSEIVQLIIGNIPIRKERAIFLTGAASEFLMPCLKKELKNEIRLVSDNPAYDNAIGFAYYGQR